MNVYDWMKENDHPDSPPLNEPGTREDPSNKPHIPDTINDDGTRELHSDAGGGRVKNEEEHHQERTIADPDQSTEETVSNEGLVSSVRKLFGLHNRGRGYSHVDGDDKARFRNVENELKTTFADPSWVNNQTPIKGEVNTKDISEKCDLKDVASSINMAFDSCVKLHNAKMEALKKFYAQLKPGLDLIAKKNGISDPAYDTLKKELSAAKPTSELYRGPSAPKVNASPVDKLPPMPLKEMVDIGRLVTEKLNSLNELLMGERDTIISISKGMDVDEFTQYMWSESSDINHRENKTSYTYEAWRALGKGIEMKAVGGVAGPYMAKKQFEETCIAAVIYMERSIKGGKVSNEDFEQVGKL